MLEDASLEVVSVVTSTIGAREEAAFLSERIDVIAGALKRREEPLDGDASILEEVAREVLAASKEAGDWPHGVVSRGKVLGWAHRILSVVEHLRETVGTELEATQNYLRQTALELQGHAAGLRPTGTWPIPPEAAPEPVDDEAPTEPIMQRSKL